MSGILESKVYEPTVKEAAILEVLLNPEHRMKSITDICKLAGCSRNIYYEAFGKPEFRALYESKVKDLVKQGIGPIINTFYKEALQGNFQHGKVLLEMAGLYNENKKVDLSIDGDINIQQFTSEQCRERILELFAKMKQSEEDSDKDSSSEGKGI